LTFKLAYSIFWNRETDNRIDFEYFNISDFWNDLENQFNDDNKELILFAHNMEFDFKILNGFKELAERNWKLQRFYIKYSVFIMVFKKDNYTLRLWSTTNYVAKPLKAIGKSLGLEKLSVDFEKDSIEYLMVYCKRDTEIIYFFIRKLLNFLETNDLSKLKATAGSLSLSTFRHKFYDDKLNKIMIHNWSKAIELERGSYRGGITDCFHLGKHKDTYKLDINSMYPDIMKKERLPTRLVGYFHESNNTQNRLTEIKNKATIDKRLTYIASITIDIPKESAYILNDYGYGKTTFCYGKNIEITLCKPEIEFLLENNGNLITIHEISVYYTEHIFKTFVDFFYDVKQKAKQINDGVNESFSKLILNSLYGKFGQKEIIYEVLKADSEFLKKNYDLINLMIFHYEKTNNTKVKDNSICYLGSINRKYQLYIIDKQLYRIKQTNTNTYDSFVAISSFITSFARMRLVYFILKAKRENVFYCDTDSLFTNINGYNNLKPYIDELELGKLKLEGFGISTIYAPKFYDFNDVRKAKGIKKNSKLISENSKSAKYINERWNRFKTDLKQGITSKQVIITSTKEILKKYDKGLVENNIVIPYSINYIKEFNQK
jgi:hypothetical protein